VNTEQLFIQGMNLIGRHILQAMLSLLCLFSCSTKHLWNLSVSHYMCFPYNYNTHKLQSKFSVTLFHIIFFFSDSVIGDFLT
jgi:hypothetical protein